MAELALYEPGRLFQTTKPMGMGGLSDRELGIDVPRLQLIHNVSGPNDIGRPGQWKLSGQLFDTVPLVVLKGEHFRTLIEGEGKGARTVCASSGGERPLDTIANPRDTNCKLCAYSQWSDGVGGKRVAPPCGDGIALLTLVLKPAPGSSIPVQPAWVLCRKAATQKATALGRQLVDRGAQTFADYQITMGAEYKKPAGVGWYEPTFTIGERTEEYRVVVQYVEQHGISYIPFVTNVAVDAPAAAPVPESDPWEVPV